MIKQSERAVNTEGESIILDTIVEKIAIFEANVPGGGGGGVLPYLGYTGTCRWIGYGFLASLS